MARCADDARAALQHSVRDAFACVATSENGDDQYYSDLGGKGDRGGCGVSGATAGKSSALRIAICPRSAVIAIDGPSPTFPVIEPPRPSSETRRASP